MRGKEHDAYTNAWTDDIMAFRDLQDGGWVMSHGRRQKGAKRGETDLVLRLVSALATSLP